MSVTVLLEDHHVRAIRDARDRLRALAELGVNVELLVSDLSDIIDRAQAERQHSLDYRAIALAGAQAMSFPEAGGYAADDPKSDGYHGRFADVYDIREGK